MRSRFVRVLAMVGALSTLGIWLAVGAQAHVTVSAPGATSGGSDQLITFRVPTESDTASTVGLTVQLPPQRPIASVLVAPHTGWTDKVTSKKLATPIKTDDGNITEAVSTIVWTADAPADGIKPGQFDQFVVIAGQLPTAKSLTFPAIQKYSDGSIVSWTEVAAAGSGAEPEHPAPVLDLADSAATTGSDSSSAPTVSSSAAQASGASTGAATTGIVLGAVGVVLGGAALLLSWRRRDTPVG